MTTAKLRIGVLFGGRSGEHEVSLRSARSVMAALDPDRYEVVPIGITKDGRWLAGDAMAALSESERSLEQIAASQGNAIATSRNLLKRVYLKTGVNRQNELARVMLNSPLLLPGVGDSQPQRQH